MFIGNANVGWNATPLPLTWFDMLRMNGVAGVCFRDVTAAAVPCLGFFIAWLSE